MNGRNDDDVHYLTSRFIHADNTIAIPIESCIRNYDHLGKPCIRYGLK